MKVELNYILAQQKELRGYVDSLIQVRKQVNKYKDNVNEAWQGKEVEILNRTLEKILRDMKHLEMEMDDIGQDLIRAHQELEETSENQD